MNIPELLRNISDRLQTTATVKAVYGDPIESQGRTVIPVARVRYGFGGGEGSQGAEPASEDEEGRQAIGGGGGGGVEVPPVGMIEITETETRYISFEERRAIVRAVLIGCLVALFLLRRRRRH